MILRFFEKILFALYALILLLAFSLAGVYFGLSGELPQLPQRLENINLSLPTEIYSNDGELLKVFGERLPVPLEKVSPFFLKAVVAVEDAHFYEHQGVDHKALVRALISNFKAKRIAQGGSTITQQLAKNLFFSFERKWVRKFKEILIALQMEASFSKDQILEAYCNQIYFGNGAYGVEEASHVYFGKSAEELSALQAALLAGLPNSPNNANPFTNYERAMARAGFVLDRMVKERMIGAAQKEEALSSSLELASPVEVNNPHQYFVNFVLDDLEKTYGKEFVYFGGLKIFTTLDARLQTEAQKAARSHLEGLDKRMGERSKSEPLQVALVSMENKTGAIRVLLGGRNYSHSQFNRAVSNNRMPGSSFKPFVYFTAMEKLGYSPASMVRDEPITMEIRGTQPWEPKNFEEDYAGDLILKKALMKSINVVSAKLIQQVGPEEVVKTARKFGVKSPLGAHMSLALGTSGASPLEMASAYGVIARLGMYVEPYLIQKIENFNGRVIYEHFYRSETRFPAKSIYPLLDMMQGVVDGGTGRTVRRMGFKHPAAGKTGTTNNFKDAWFTGFTRDYSTSVWVGYDSNEPMVDPKGRGLTGSGAAAPIWVFFMKKALENKSLVKFTVPDGVRIVQVNPTTGYLLEEGSSEPGMFVAVKDETVLTLPPLPSPPPALSSSQALSTLQQPEKTNDVPNF